MSGALRGEAHVWYARPEPFCGADHCSSLLSQGERHRWARFHFEEDRQSYLAAHALLRLVLSRYASVRPEDWMFEANRYGRPELAAEFAHLGLRFNLSHTRGLVACVVATTACGIDVECTRNAPSGLDLRDYLADAELEEMERSREGGDPARILTFWTLKEAYAKARGLGLALPFKQLSFAGALSSSPLRLVTSGEIDERPERWQFSRLTLFSRYLCAVAVRRDAESPLRIAARPYDPLPSASIAHQRPPE